MHARLVYDQTCKGGMKRLLKGDVRRTLVAWCVIVPEKKKKFGVAGRQ